MVTGETGGPPVVSKETIGYPSIAHLCAVCAANFGKDDYGDLLRFTTVTIVKTINVHQPDRSQTTGVTLIKQIDIYIYICIRFGPFWVKPELGLLSGSRSHPPLFYDVRESFYLSSRWVIYVLSSA